MQSLPVNNDFSSHYSFLTVFKVAFRKESKKKRGALMRAATFRFLLTEILSQDSQDGDVMFECCNSL